MSKEDKDQERVPRSSKSEARTFTYVYLIQSLKYPEQKYIGITSNLRRRLADHNSGHTKHTSKWKPWGLRLYLGFENLQRAREFELYLKSHSGQAFANKRFW